MERRDLYEDDLTEERYPSPARRDEAASTLILDPDTPAGIEGDPDLDDDNDDDEEDEDDDDEDDDV